MGEVWLVADVTTRVLYAAKFLRAELARTKDIERFKRECRTLSDFEHENIIKVFCVVEEDGTPGYLMEYCPDGSLEDKLPLGLAEQALDITRALLKAVAYIHERGFIHRDIKPFNILFAPDGTLRLSDFGLVVEDDPDRTVLTTSNWVSEGFAAPEQFSNMASVTKSADIYSVGAVLFYLATGATFRFDLPLEPQIAPCNAVFRYVFRRTLLLSAEERAQNADGLLSAVDEFSQRKLVPFFSLSQTKRIERLKEIVQSYAVVNSRELSYMESVLLDYDFLGSILVCEDEAAVKAKAKEAHTFLERTMRDLVHDIRIDYWPREIKKGYANAVEQRLWKK